MSKTTATLAILNNAMEKLKSLAESSYGDDIIGAKAMDVGLRLTAQFCIRGLLDKGMKKHDIARQLKLDSSTPGYWLMARVTPRLDRLEPLIALYREKCRADYSKARKTEALIDRT